MTPLEQQAADYLRIRRALGFKLERAEKLLAQYLAYLDTTGQDRVTVENALQWARLPTAAAGTGGLSGCRSCAASRPTCTPSILRTRSRQQTCSRAGSDARSPISIPSGRSGR